jgi:HlyD family secretion protein
MTVTVSGNGTVTPIRQVGLRFELTAPVSEILIDEGQQVHAGDVIARLDTTELSQSLQDAEIALQRQQVSYSDLIAPARDVDIAAAEAAVNSAYASLAAAQQGATPEQIETARLQAELARNQLWQSQIQRDRYMDLPPEFRAGGGGAVANEIQQNSGLTSQEYQISINETNYANLVNQGPDMAALGSATAQLAQAQVSLDRLNDGATELELQRAELDLQSAQLSIDQAQAAVDKAVLYAPFDGVIAENNLVVGEIPPSVNAAVLLLDSSEFYVELQIDETDIIDVQLGQPVNLTLEALAEDEVAGTVTRVSVVPTPTDQQLVTYAVRVTLSDTDAPVRTGMSATATVVVNDLEDAIIVPNRFIRIDRASQQAFATIQDDDGKFQEVPVELGLRNDFDTQVISGLSDGDQVYLLPRGTFNPLAGG